MKVIPEYEEIIKKGTRHSYPEDLCVQVFHAYEYSKETCNERPNFTGTIWQKDIPQIVAALRQFEFSEFTVSGTMSGMLEVIAGFEDNGAKLQGIIKVGSLCKDMETGGREMRPAFLMKLI